MSSDESTRAKILLAAGPIFAERGFRCATVREICDAAGVNLASVNYYFHDKQNLYIETVMQARAMRAQQVPFPDWPVDSAPEARLRMFIRFLLQRVVASDSAPWEVRLLMREFLEPTEACRRLVEEHFRPVFDRLLGLIDELVGVRLDDATRNQVGFSIIGQCLHYRYSSFVIQLLLGEDDPTFSIDELTEHITRFSLGGIESIRQRIEPTANANATSNPFPAP